MIRLKTSNRCVLHILVLLSLTTISFAQSPGNPVITGPTFIVEGNSVALTCTSSGGNPVPTVYWYRNGQLVDDTQTTTNGVTSNTYNFVADKTHNLAVFECQVDNNVLQNKLSTTWFFQVYTEPNQPTLTGSQSLSPGSTYVWTCISTGGNPAPTLTMRIGSSQFNTGITQSSVLQSDNTYTVTSSLSWAPSVSNNGQTLFCDVQHSETRGNNLQTVSLQLTVTAPLSVSAPQTQYQQNVGTLVVMNCVITGTATSITWYFNNQLINIASSSKYSNGNTINPSLTVSNVALSDAGQYYCQATNGLTTANSNTITLTVLGSIPVVTVSQPTYSGTTGQSVTLQCTVSSPNDALQSVSWTFNNGASTIIIAAFSNTAKYSGTTTTTPSLTIFNLASTDAGTYTCSATNTIGTGSSSATSLSVTGNLLSVTIPQSSYSVLTGQQVTIPCTVTGTPIQTNVFWRKVVNGVQTDVDINGNSRYSGGTTSSPSLTIINTQSSDEGTYVCYASNNIGTSNSQNTFLDITGGVPTVTIRGSNFQVQVGNSITIGCTVTANPAVTSVYWTRDINGQSTVIGPSSNPSKYGGSTTVTPSLTILNANISDAGNYQCFATNNIGTGSSQQALLDVQGSPGNPVITGPTFILEGDLVVLTCSSSGGNPVPTVYWYRNGQLVDDTQTTTNGVTSNTYHFLADKTHNQTVFKCQVDNNVLQNKLSTTWLFQVYSPLCYEPNSKNRTTNCSPEIYQVYPASGPVNGGTLLTISGNYLGNINDSISIDIGGVKCHNVTVRTPYTKLTCVIGKYKPIQTTGIFVSVNSINYSDLYSLYFTFKEPKIFNFSPKKGILSGNTVVAIKGHNIDFESQNRYTIYFCDGVFCIECSETQTTLSLQNHYIKCKTGISSEPRNMTQLIVVIDDLTKLTLNETFQYLPDPSFKISTEIPKTFQSGGVLFTIRGEGFNNVGAITVEGVDNPCEVLEDTSTECETPPRLQNQPNNQTIDVHFDGVTIQFPIEYVEDPTFEMFQDIVMYDKESSIEIEGRSILNVARLEDYHINIGLDGICLITDISMNKINCLPPKSVPRTNNTDDNTVYVIVNVIRIKSYIGDLQYSTETITEDGNTFVMIVGILVAGLVVSIIIGMSARLVLRRKKTKAANEFKMKIKAKEEIIQKASIEGERIANLRMEDGNAYTEPDESVYDEINADEEKDTRGNSYLDANEGYDELGQRSPTNPYNQLQQTRDEIQKRNIKNNDMNADDQLQNNKRRNDYLSLFSGYEKPISRNDPQN